MSGVVDGTLYIAGGACKNGAQKTAERLRFGQAQWESIPDMSIARQDAVSCVVGTSLYICGGISKEMKDDMDIVNLRVVERFDHRADVWEVLEPLAFPLNRYTSIGAAVAGQMYIFGCCVEERHQAVAQRFDPELGRWEAAPPPPTKRMSPLSTIIDGRIYACGGHDLSVHSRSKDQDTSMEWSSGILDTAESFDPETGLWEALPPMHTRRTLLGRAGAGLLVFLSSTES
jgi:hypothetical protein